MSFKDEKGKEHNFYIRIRILSTGLLMEADEVINGEMKGRRIIIRGELGDDPEKIFQKLCCEVRKTLKIW